MPVTISIIGSQFASSHRVPQRLTMAAALAVAGFVPAAAFAAAARPAQPIPPLFHRPR
jgi:hypothetical protein